MAKPVNSKRRLFLAPSASARYDYLMQNIDMKRTGDKLVITIDLSKDFGPSTSGKTLIVASTRGNAPVPDTEGTMIGINCFKYKEPKKRK